MTLLAVGVGHRGWALAGVAAAVAATQLSVGWVNDWLDADRDRVAGRRDKPVASGEVSRRTVGIAGLISSLLIPLLGLPFGLPATVCITLVGVFALLYDWPLKSTALSVVPYLVAFGLLPAFVVVALPGHPAPPIWLVGAGALLGGGAHFANVLPDLADDAATGVRGLPHRLGAAGSRVAAAALMLAATAVLALGAPVPHWLAWSVQAVAIAVLGIGLWLGRRPGSRAPFRAVLVVAAIAVVLLVAAGPAVIG
jgi:protoheme IX farnesyltransferase